MNRIIFASLILFLASCTVEGQTTYRDPASMATQASYQGNNALATISSQSMTATRTYAIETEIAVNKEMATERVLQATYDSATYAAEQYQVTAAVSTSQALATVDAYAFQATTSIEDIYRGATATAVANLGLLDSSMIYLEATRQSLEFEKQSSELRQKNLMLTALIAIVLIFVLTAAVRFLLVTRRQTTPVVIPEQPGRVFVYGNGWQGDRETRVALPAPVERPLLMEPANEPVTNQQIIELPARLPKNKIGLGITRGNAGLWYTQGQLGDILGAGIKGSGKSNVVRSIAYQAYKSDWKLYLADAELLTFDPLVWGNVASSTNEVEGMLNSLITEFDRRIALFSESFQIVRQNSNPHFVEDLAQYNQVAARYGLESLPPILFALDEANNLLGSSNTLDEALHEVLRRNRKPGCTVALFAHTWHSTQVRSAIFTNLTRRIAFRCEERTSRVVLHSPIASSIPNQPGAMIMKEDGKDIKVQSYFLPAQRILSDVQPIEGEWEEVDRPVRKNRLEDGDREKILEMYGEGASQRKIEMDIFGYNGGKAWELVREILDQEAISF